MKDIVLNENEKVVIGNSDENHMSDIIIWGKGHNKFAPFKGAEAFKFVKSKNVNKARSAIRQNLESDGVKNLSIAEGENFELSINGNY